MKKSIFFLSALALLSMAACQRNAEPESPVQPGREITFTSSVGAYTKVTGQAFDEGDVVGLSIAGPLTVNNLPLTMTNGLLTPEETLYWAADQRDDEKAEFMAYYPYRRDAVVDGPFAFQVPLDQTVDGAYTSADFLCAQVSSAPEDGEVNLVFSHIMSRFCVNITDAMDGDDLSGIVVLDGMFSDAVVDLSAGEAALSPDAGLTGFALLPVGENQYAAVVVPQQATPTLHIQLASGKWVELVSDGELDFQPGKQIVANIVLTQSSVSFTAEVFDWIDEEMHFYTPEIPDPMYFILSIKDNMMIPQEDGTFSVQFVHNDNWDVWVFDAVTGYLYGSAYTNAQIEIGMGESVTIPLISSDVNCGPMHLYFPETDMEVLNAVLDPKTWKLTLSRPGEPEWASIGTGKFLDKFMATFLDVPATEFDVEWEMDIRRPGVGYRIVNPYANWPFKDDFGYEEGGCFNMVAMEDGGNLVMNPSYTGLHTTDGDEIYLSLPFGWSAFDFKSGNIFASTAEMGINGSLSRYGLGDIPTFLTFPDGTRPQYNYAWMEDITPGYGAENNIYYFSYNWNVGFDLLNPRWLLYYLGSEEVITDDLINTLFAQLINQEGEVYEENFPYPGRFGRRTTFVGGPGRYILAIYGPEGPDGYDFRYWDVIEIEEVNN